MSTVRKLNESALRGIYDAYMHEAFPPAELKPLAVMLRLMERGRYLCYGYYRNGPSMPFFTGTTAACCCWIILP